MNYDFSTVDERILAGLHWTGWKQQATSYQDIGQIVFLAQLKKPYCSAPGNCIHCYDAVGWYHTVLKPVEDYRDRDEIAWGATRVIGAITPMLEEGRWLEQKQHTWWQDLFVNWAPASLGKPYRDKPIRFFDWKALESPDIPKLLDALKPSDYEVLEQMRRDGKPLGNYRLPTGFGNDHRHE